MMRSFYQLYRQCMAPVVLFCVVSSVKANDDIQHKEVLKKNSVGFSVYPIDPEYSFLSTLRRAGQKNAINRIGVSAWKYTDYSFMGNVGIGTTTPDYQLTLMGGSTVSSRIRVARGTDDAYQNLLIGFNSITVTRLDVPLNSIQTNFSINQQGSDGTRSAFYINTDGNIGIGTTSPDKQLTLGGGSSTVDNRIEVKRGTDDDAQNLLIGWNNITVTRSSVSLSGAQTDFSIKQKGSDGTRIPFYINSNGNIGIGTVSPNEKLAINGNVTAKKMIITQTGWSDYVFDHTYKLTPLSKLAAFIQKYKHLPDIPSAKEVEEVGISIGDNQALLLRKIEELTLYIIDQQKKIDEVRREMKILKTEQLRLRKGSAKQ